MPTRTDSADPRATRVRERIKEAAFALVEQHRVEDISVRDVVTAAEVSRQVFYGHFRDRDDAVAQADGQRQRALVFPERTRWLSTS